MQDKLVQLLKANVPIVETDSGKYIFSSLLQF